MATLAQDDSLTVQLQSETFMAIALEDTKATSLAGECSWDSVIYYSFAVIKPILANSGKKEMASKV